MEKRPYEKHPTTDKHSTEKLLRSRRLCFIVRQKDATVVTDDPSTIATVSPDALFISHPVTPADLGSPEFRSEYGVRYAYMAGAMAGGIAGVPHVVALGSAGLLGTLGAGGLPLPRVEEAIVSIRKALADRPFAVNLIHNPFDRQLEMKTAELLVKHDITITEASAFMRLTPAIVYYRAKGLREGQDGSVRIHNRVIAKVSRRSVAQQFMAAAPSSIVNKLLNAGAISATEAQLLSRVPMADDITVEADSGGHTDNLPLVGILPAIVQLRDTLHLQHGWSNKIRIGAAGGISTPYAALAALTMGADYLVTGSINQSCIEASTSDAVKQALARAEVPDVTMAPAADMFELGVKVQVLKKGVFYPARAALLYSLYNRYSSLEELSEEERNKVEKEIFGRSIEAVWNDTRDFFEHTAPHILKKAEKEPKTRMALVFRWYLGLSTRWAKAGEPGRESDYQIWCGPSMGAFNTWVMGTELEFPENRKVAEVAELLLRETAYLRRLASIKAAGFAL